MEKAKFLGIVSVLVVILGGFLIVYYGRSEKNSMEHRQSVESTAQNSANVIPDWQLYMHTFPAFSFQYPKGFKITIVPGVEGGEGGETITFDREAKESFQIALLPFDEPGPITKERILRDMPNMIIKNEQSDVIISGVPAFAFSGSDPAVGETFEIWFIQNGTLYQASTFASFKDNLKEILSTWKF